MSIVDFFKFKKDNTKKDLSAADASAVYAEVEDEHAASDGADAAMNADTSTSFFDGGASDGGGGDGGGV